VSTAYNRPAYIYITELPEIIGILLPFSVLGIYISFKKRQKVIIWLFLSTLFLFSIMMLVKTRHIRYVFETITMFSIISAFYMGSIKNKKIFLFLVATVLCINLLGSLYGYNYYLNYPKHVEMKSASLWIKNNCKSPVFTNAEGFIEYYTGFKTIYLTKENLNKYQNVSCILFSKYEYIDQDVLNELSKMKETYRDGDVLVYKK
jgi:hypothetical protein